jgi:hypothetical protein
MPWGPFLPLPPVPDLQHYFYRATTPKSSRLKTKYDLLCHNHVLPFSSPDKRDTYVHKIISAKPC